MSRVPDATWAFRVPGMALEALSDALDVAGIEADGLSEDRGTATAWFTDRPDAMPVAGTWDLVPRTDWAEAWKAGLDPVVVGDVTVAMPWHAPDGPRLDGPPWTLVVEPGLAFGTGHHETTTACLALLQELDLLGRRVADVGTGTGVLALAARAMGAAEVIAVDNDPEAVEVALANVESHGLAGPAADPTGGPPRGGVLVRLGSCEAVDGTVDVVVANIITDRLLALAPELAALLRPDGILLCCGIAHPRTDEAVAAFTALGLQVTARPGVEWTALLASRAAPAP